MATLLITGVTVLALLISCAHLCARSRPTWSPWRWLGGMLLIGAGFSLVPVFMFAAEGLLWRETVGSSVVSLGLGGLMWLYCRWHYHRQMDFTDPAYLRTSK